MAGKGAARRRQQSIIGGPVRFFAAAAVVSLCACTSQAEEAEKRYRMVKRAGSLGEACEAGRAVADAHLQAGNESEYEKWRAFAGVDCSGARLYGRDAPADRAVREEAEKAARDLEGQAERLMREVDASQN